MAAIAVVDAGQELWLHNGGSMIIPFEDAPTIAKEVPKMVGNKHVRLVKKDVIFVLLVEPQRLCPLTVKSCEEES